MPQYSKIRALPKDMLQDLEMMLDHGATEEFCAKELNDEIHRREPGLDHIIKDGPISRQNVHLWKHSDYAAKKVAKQIQKGIEENAEREKRQDHLTNILGWLTAKIAAEIIALDQNPPDPETYAVRIQHLITAAINLQKIENDQRWLLADEKRANATEARVTMALKLAARKIHKENDDEEARRHAMEHLAPLAPALIKNTIKQFEELAKPDEPQLHHVLRDLDPERETAIRAILTEEELIQLGFEPSDDEHEADTETPEQRESEINKEAASDPGI